MLRLYEFDLADGYFPTINYTTMIHTPHKPIIRYKKRLPWGRPATGGKHDSRSLEKKKKKEEEEKLRVRGTRHLSNS